MDTHQCISTRKSYRRFLSVPIDENILREVLAAALRAPSYKNSQPWELRVVMGEARDKLSKILIGLLESGVPVSPDLPHPESWPAANDERIRLTMASRKEFATPPPSSTLASLHQLAPNPKLANLSFYGAPAAIFLFQDETLSDWSILDAGMLVQNILLGFHARGWGAVPQAFLADYAPQIREFFDMPHRRLLLGISVGYPDPDARINQFVSPRAPFDEVVKILS